MLNTSYSFVRLFLFALLNVITLQECTANLQLPFFEKYSVTLPMIHLRRDPSGGPKSTYSYILSLPKQILNKTIPNNINSVLSISKQSINNFPSTLSYKVLQMLTPVNLFINVQTYNFTWNSLELTILLFSKQTYPSLTIGQLSVANAQQRITLSTSTKISYPYKQNLFKTLVFINGINIQHIRNLQYGYQVNIVENLNSNTGEFVVTVSSGDNTQLNQIYLTYLIYSIEQSQYEISGIYLNLNDIGIGKYGYYLGNSMSSSMYLLTGLSSFKFNKGPGQFSISLGFKQGTQNVLGVNISQPLSLLNVAVFRIGNKANNICKSCFSQNIIFNKAPKTACVSSCSQGTSIKNALSQVSECLVCPTQLHFITLNGKCECMNGFVDVNGQCLTQQQTKSTMTSVIDANPAITFSKKNSDCVDPHSFKSPSGSCICKKGYQNKKVMNAIICTSICQSGYHNGQKCVTCPSGTYPWSQLQTCLPCSKDCKICQSQYVCKQCANGFMRTNDGQCKQICGDSMKINDQCDDGNNNNGDGCSSECKIQIGYNCQQDGKKIKHTKITYKSGNLQIQYQMQPPPPKLYSSNQLQDRIRLKFRTSPPYQTFLAHNKNNLSLFKIVATYAGIAPTIPVQIQVQFILPNDSTFTQTIVKDFVNQGRTFSRQINNKNDILAP